MDARVEGSKETRTLRNPLTLSRFSLGHRDVQDLLCPVLSPNDNLQSPDLLLSACNHPSAFGQLTIRRTEVQNAQLQQT